MRTPESFRKVVGELPQVGQVPADDRYPFEMVGPIRAGSSMIEPQPSHPDHGTRMRTMTMTIASTSTSIAWPKRDC
jgi:hypothetical protein